MDQTKERQHPDGIRYTDRTEGGRRVIRVTGRPEAALEPEPQEAATNGRTVR